jgi:hypothetical protein
LAAQRRIDEHALDLTPTARIPEYRTATDRAAAKPRHEESEGRRTKAFDVDEVVALGRIQAHGKRVEFLD